ncbi:MAG: S8 family serine peptidase [Phycisphaerae bacterium]
MPTPRHVGSKRASRAVVAAVDALESRTLMSVAPAVDAATATRLADNGFAAVTWQHRQAYAAPNEWVVELNKGFSIKAANKLVKGARADLEVVEKLTASGDRVLVRVPAGAKAKAAYAALAGLRGVGRVEPNFAIYAEAVTPNDTYYSPHQWGLNNTGQDGGTADADIDAPEAWDVTTGSSSVVVAVVDSGIDYAHPDLAANMWRNPGEVAGDGVDNDGNGYKDDVYGWNFVSNSANPMDDYGHGTHVAGIIAAVGNNAAGVTGTSWNSKVMALKFLGSSGTGSTANAIKALDYAKLMKTTYGANVRVINNSWGGGGYSTTLQNAIARTATAGMLFVAAAGNGGTDQVGDNNDATPVYPPSSTSANVVAVAATDRNDALASFSNYGPTSVDLAAPGVDIASTYPSNGYVYMSGTSMATPYVSGVAALAFGLRPASTYQQVKDALLNGVDKVAGLTGKVLTGGRLNARGTVNLLIGQVSSSAASVAQGQSVTLSATGLGASTSRVEFSLETNGVAGVQFDGANPDLLLATDASGADGWSAPVSTFGWAAGWRTVYATATQSGARLTPAPLTTLTVTPVVVANPRVLSVTRDPSAVMPTFYVQFNVDVSPGLTAADFVLRDPAAAATDLSYDTATNVATVRWNGALPVGNNWLDVVEDGAVVNAAGTGLEGERSFAFFYLPGDADLNRKVDLNDLVTVSNHYGLGTGASWLQGDFDHDGAVGLNDLVILSNLYGTELPTPA